ASGNVEVSILHLVCIGGLLASLVLWASWALSEGWTGWSNDKVRNASLGACANRAVLLLVVSIWTVVS
uniref:TIGR03758 family integrating conjugative element protein n=1 Tax=Salmonella enterica TaxID=28901 RepID=UPI00398C45B2